MPVAPTGANPSQPTSRLANGRWDAQVSVDRSQNIHASRLGASGAAAVALRNGLRDGVSEEAREAASSSPAVAAGAHALWKLPPRALWDDLSLRLPHL